MAKKNGKATTADRASRLLAGAQKRLAAIGPLMIAGASFTPAQVEQQLQEVLALRADVKAAQATAKAKVGAERARLPTLRGFMGALEKTLRANFGEDPEFLGDFGLNPRKPATPLTVEQQAAAAAKREATRAARGTKSAKAKKAIKGNVIGVQVIPVVAGAPAPDAVHATDVAPPATPKPA